MSSRVFPLSVVILLTCACGSDPAKVPGLNLFFDPVVGTST